MHGEGRVALEEALGIGQRDRDVALHVGRAAAVQALVLHHGRQRVDAPGLAVPGHRVGVAREDHAGRLALAQRGEQVRLGALGVVGDAALHAEGREVRLGEVDQLEVAVCAHRVHANQGLRHQEALGRKRVLHATDCPGS
ncbi:hypothetical protein D9M69_554860 [compost metagenome]